MRKTLNIIAAVLLVSGLGAAAVEVAIGSALTAASLVPAISGWIMGAILNPDLLQIK